MSYPYSPSGLLRPALVLVAVALCASACSDPDETLTLPSHTDGGPPPADQNPYGALGRAWAGTRLKPEFAQPEGGTRMFMNWIDTGLNRACWFRMGADGRMRCYPWINSPARNQLFYGDARCRNAIMTVDGSNPVRDEVYVVEEPSSCGAGWRAVRPTGERRWIENGPLFMRATLSGDCVAIAAAGRSAGGYAVSVKDADEELVSAEFVRPRAKGVFGPVMLRASDGAVQRWGWRPKGAGFDCNFGSGGEMFADGSGTIRCVPIQGARFTAWAGSGNESCQNSGEDLQPRHCFKSDYDVVLWTRCSGLRPVTRKLTEQSFAGVEIAGEMCRTVPGAFRRTTSEDVTATLPMATIGERRGQGRIVYRPAVFDGGEDFGTFWDTKYDVACKRSSIDHQCVPTEVAQASYAGQPDPECKQRPVYTVTSTECKDAKFAVNRAIPNSGIFQLVNRYSGPIYLMDREKGCQPAGDVTDAWTVSYPDFVKVKYSVGE